MKLTVDHAIPECDPSSAMGHGVALVKLQASSVKWE